MNTDIATRILPREYAELIRKRRVGQITKHELDEVVALAMWDSFEQGEIDMANFPSRTGRLETIKQLKDNADGDYANSRKKTDTLIDLQDGVKSDPECRKYFEEFDKALAENIASVRSLEILYEFFKDVEPIRAAKVRNYATQIQSYMHEHCKCIPLFEWLED